MEGEEFPRGIATEEEDEEQRVGGRSLRFGEIVEGAGRGVDFRCVREWRVEDPVRARKGEEDPVGV